MNKIGIDKYNSFFILFLTADFFFLLFTADSLSISYSESLNYFNNINELTLLTYASTFFFGQNDIALRLPFILIYLVSTVLIYRLTDDYFTKKSDRLISVAIFMLLPGVNSAALLVNTSILVIFSTVLYLYIYKTTKKHSYLLLIFFLLLDNSFAILFLALFFYSLSKKDNKLLIISLVLFGISMYMYGFDTGGKPKGYFLDTFAIFASIFSPLLFLYFFYSMYRIFIRGNRDLFWYISFTALVFSFILSLRQRIIIEDFAPFVVIAVPLMVKLFFHSLRVRLPQFRKKHLLASYIVLSVLILNFLVFIFNKPLYLILQKPQRHFAYNYHFAKDIAISLKRNNIDNITSNDKKLILRLRFYGLKEGTENYITLKTPKNYDMQLPINYLDKNILNVYVTKLNIN